MNNQERQKERAVHRRQTPPRVPISNKHVAHAQDYNTMQSRLNKAVRIIEARTLLIKYLVIALVIVTTLLVFMFLFALSVQSQASQEQAAIERTIRDRATNGPTAADFENGGM